MPAAGTVPFSTLDYRVGLGLAVVMSRGYRRSPIRHLHYVYGATKLWPGTGYRWSAWLDLDIYADVRCCWLSVLDDDAAPFAV